MPRERKDVRRFDDATVAIEPTLSNSSTCTDLDCNHRGVSDLSHFAWSVGGDADLVLSRYENNSTVYYYEKSFSPAAQAALPAAERKSFTGNIRFTHPGLYYSPGSTSVTVTATSEELPSETDTLTLIPQYVNLATAGVDEEAFAAGTGTLTNAATAEGTAGMFVPVNDNDSNANRNVDSATETEGTSLADGADLVELTINYKIDGPVNETNPVRLTLGNSGGGFRVWKDAARSELLLGGSVTSVNFTSKGAIPASVFLEAQSATSHLRNQ